jgi:hypothetical protein
LSNVLQLNHLNIEKMTNIFSYYMQGLQNSIFESYSELLIIKNRIGNILYVSKHQTWDQDPETNII